MAGFARGEAEVLLEPDADGTILSYTAQATIGGKLAQIGQRLIDGAAKQIADDFFTRFAATVSAAKVLATSSIPAAASPESSLGRLFRLPPRRPMRGRVSRRKSGLSA